MKEIHLINIDYIEQNTEKLPFKYKPEVPKLKLYGEVLISETEEEEEAIVFLTQKQLNQIIGGKGIEIVSEEDKWYVKHPLSKDQIKQIGLVDIEAELIGTTNNNLKCFEVVEIK
ncbi:MAG: hypothetical protein D6799_00565 [Bacteroidetes bacterium]|jgi:hypothetical protein|nr:MAG: hypothetical protein D6799_00565 [Bacteroidota bacterium]